MKFTPEEISLCKQVAERHLKDVPRGGWYLPREKDTEPELATINICSIKSNPLFKGAIPFWTISDCLEFLRKKGYTLEQHFEDDGFIHVALCDAGSEVKGRGDTDLEAFLKAVLMMLEEEEKK